jgi:hypothetical protein
MTKSGLAEQTIILMIQESATKFDTSPEAIIDLKKAGVSDAVLNAILGTPHRVTSLETTSVAQAKGDCSQALEQALASIGTQEKLNAVRSTLLVGQSVASRPSGTSSFRVERITSFPASIYISLVAPSGVISKSVLTPGFNYLVSGKMTSTIPANTIQELRSGLTLDPVNISQHRDRYSCSLEGTEQLGNFKTSKIAITGEGVEGYWNIEPASGRILRSTVKVGASEQIVTGYSDWRQINGIIIPFKRHSVKADITTDVTLEDFQVNPTIDPNVFQPLANPPADSLTFRVLQEESVPYVVQTNGGISTACNISGNAYTDFTASTLDNTTHGWATSNSNLRMNCKSTDTTIRWTHVLNAMLVEASDGNAYIIACDRAWLWSKCTPLRAGDTFFAERTDKGFRVQSVNSKSKEQEAIYSVLRSKSLHQ